MPIELASLILGSTFVAVYAMATSILVHARREHY
jgi:hypothetical protein